MLVYAGIDEAGYGPLLGPLCVGCTTFVLESHVPEDGEPRMWRLLGQAVCRKPADRRRRVAVNDSKKLKAPNDGPGHPLRHLERGVLTFCPGDDLPISENELLEVLATEPPRQPWLAAGSGGLPLAHTADELRVARGRVTRALRRAAMSCEAMWCTAIQPDDFNRSVADSGNKADLNFRAAMRLVERVWRRWPEDHPRVVVDRHGGRIRYGASLAAALPATEVTVVAETSTVSRYTLRRGGSRITVSFALEGDGRFLPVALASMTAKYVRELVMALLNRFFQQHLPDLKPTAGYYGDARRYIAEIKPVIERLRLPRSDLVRRV